MLESDQLVTRRKAGLPRWIRLGLAGAIAYAAMGQLSLWTSYGNRWFLFASNEAHRRFIAQVALGIWLLCVLLTAVEPQPRSARHAAYAVAVAVVGGMLLHLIGREFWPHLDGGCWTHGPFPDGFVDLVCVDLLPRIESQTVAGFFYSFTSLVVEMAPLLIGTIAIAFLVGAAIQGSRDLLSRRHRSVHRSHVVT